MLLHLKKPSSYYDVLKITPLTDNTAVRAAYLKLMQENDAIKSPAFERQKIVQQRLLNEAFAALRTETGRNLYNRLLLTSKGKPKGLSIRAINDNTSTSNDRESLIRKISAFFAPQTQNKETDHG